MLFLLLCCLAFEGLKARTRSYNIVFIGNSITYGATHRNSDRTAPPVQCAAWLSAQDGIDTVSIVNCGRSGRTTYHFLPDKGAVVPKGDPTYFDDVVRRTRRLQAEHPDRPLVFSIMLGTNDSAERPRNHRTAPGQYVRNMTVIIDSLLALWPDAHVVLQRVIYYTPGYVTKMGSVMDDSSLAMLRRYYEGYGEIIAHCRRGHVHIGDTLAYDYFKTHYRTDVTLQHGGKGEPYYLHPNEQGAKVLGEYWGKAILRVLPKTKAPDVYVARWQGNRKAAISYTFDDGLLEHYTVLRPRLKEYRFPATFAIVGSEVGRDHKGTPLMTWRQLRELKADGHEMSSHGYEHKNVTKLTAEQLRHELQANDTLMHDSLGVWPRTFIYPGNRRSKETVAVCEKGRVGSRTSLMSLGGKRDDRGLRQWVDGLIRKGGWEVTMTHGISYGYDHFQNPEVLWRHFAYVDSLRSKIWVGTFADVSAYVKERNAVSLAVKRQKDGTTVVTPRMEMDRELYNLPLTMVVRTTKDISATQDGKSLAVINEDSLRMIDFNPHGGPVTIREDKRLPAWDDTRKRRWDSRFRQVDIGAQKAYVYKSRRAGMPLIVSLHTWSGGYEQADPIISREVLAEDWNYIHPHFQGPNNSFDAMCSPKVILDIENAIRWAVDSLDADPDEVHVVGVSGGGLATLALFMSGTYPVKSFSAWAPISDIEAWYWESRGRGQKYADDIRRAIPQGSHIDEQEALRRSPLHMAYPRHIRRGTPLYIYEGIHDGYKGSVPITHALKMYNRVVGERKYNTDDQKKIYRKAEKDRSLLSCEEMMELVVKRINPSADPNDNVLGRQIFLHRECENVSVTIFEGRHEQLPGALKLIPVTPSPAKKR